MTRGLIIRTQELGGKIVAIGGDHALGIVPEGENFTADIAGPAGGTVTLKRDPHKQWPDLRAYAPVTILDRGQVVMRGRIKNTPMTDGGLARQASLQIEGMQFHLDDDAYERNYITTDLTKFVDTRSSLLAPLVGASCFPQGGQVTVGGGAIVLGLAQGQDYPNGTFVGVTLDFGTSLCSNVAVNWTNSNNALAALGGASAYFYCTGSDSPDGAAGDNAFAFLIDPSAVPAAAFNTGSFSAPRRYVNLFINLPVGATPTADVLVQIIPPTALFADPSYASAGTSVLLASTVLLDALDRATLRLSADRSLIQSTSFFIPELTMSGPSTPREVGVAVNDYHNWQIRVGADNRPEFRPLPALPTIEVGSDALFNETSAGDASDIYTDVIVSYTDAAGQQQRVHRSQHGDIYSLSAIQPTNPGAEVNTAGWAVGGGSTIARTTTGGEFTTGVAGFKVTGSLANSASSNSWTAGAWIPGTSYRILLGIRGDTDSALGSAITVDGATVGTVSKVGTGAFATGLALDWVQPSTSAPVIYVTGYLPSGLPWSYYFDNLILFESVPTIINRWGFRRTYRLDSGAVLTPAAAEIIGDAFLAAHRSTPLKGDLNIPGDGRAWRTPSGQGMRCSEFLGETGELVRIAHLIDPDTGKKGRIGRIVAASWDPPSGTAKLSIDSTSGNFAALLARLGVNVGQVR